MKQRQKCTKANKKLKLIILSSLSFTPKALDMEIILTLKDTIHEENIIKYEYLCIATILIKQKLLDLQGETETH